MFYVHSLGTCTIKLVDFTTKEECWIDYKELDKRLESGETIVGATLVKDDFTRVVSKGKTGKLSIRDFATLTDKLYLIDMFIGGVILSAQTMFPMEVARLSIIGSVKKVIYFKRDQIVFVIRRIRISVQFAVER